MEQVLYYGVFHFQTDVKIQDYVRFYGQDKQSVPGKVKLEESLKPHAETMCMCNMTITLCLLFFYKQSCSCKCVQNINILLYKHIFSMFFLVSGSYKTVSN